MRCDIDGREAYTTQAEARDVAARLAQYCGWPHARAYPVLDDTGRTAWVIDCAPGGAACQYVRSNGYVG